AARRAGAGSRSVGAHGPRHTADSAALYQPAAGYDTVPSSERTRWFCTPAAHSCRTQYTGERQPLAWRRASPFFCQQVLQRCIVEHGVRKELLQPGVLALKSLQPLGLGHLKPAVLGFPVVEARLANPVLAAQLGRLYPGLVLLQDRNNLFFRIPLALHRLSFLKARLQFVPDQFKGATSGCQKKDCGRRKNERKERLRERIPRDTFDRVFTAPVLS